MPARKEYAAEFKDQAVRFVLEEIGPDESRKQACERLAPMLPVKAVTLYNWVKQSTPARSRPRCHRGQSRNSGHRTGRVAKRIDVDPVSWTRGYGSFGSPWSWRYLSAYSAGVRCPRPTWCR